MEKKCTFGIWEGSTLVINMICTKLFLNYPNIVMESGGTAAWMVVLYNTVIVALAVFLMLKLSKSFENKDLLEMAEYAAGKIGRIIVGCILIVFFIFLTSTILREYGEDMKTVFFTASPISYILLFFIAGMVAAAYMGMETLVRMHAIIIPATAVGFVILILASSPHFELNNLFPLMGNGLNNILVPGFVKISAYSEFLILFLITPFLKGKGSRSKVAWLSIGFSFLSLIAGVLSYSLIFSYPIGLESFLPIYQMARIINLGRFFQRIESVFLAMWIMGALLFLSAGFFFTLNIFQKTFRLKHYKPVIIPFAVIILTLSLIPGSLTEALSLEVNYFRSYSWIISFILPLAVILLYKFRNKDDSVNSDVKEE